MKKDNCIIKQNPENFPKQKRMLHYSNTRAEKFFLLVQIQQVAANGSCYQKVSSSKTFV
jgi:hypothetical protein